MYSVCCCMETFVLHRGHMTCSVFVRRVLCTLGAGVGVERGALGHVAGVGGGVCDKWVGVCS